MQELELQMTLYAPLAGAKGYRVPEVGRAFYRTRGNKQDESMHMLKKIYDWLDDVFNTPDLMEAREMFAADKP